jgi:hypothetical protein
MGGLKEKEVLPWLQRAKKKKMRFRRDIRVLKMK